MPITGPTTDHYEIRLWADGNRMVPIERLPQLVDHEPATLCLLALDAAKSRQDLRRLTWEEFFAKFDELGLAFVYDADSTGYSELLQREEASPYRSRVNQMPDMMN